MQYTALLRKAPLLPSSWRNVEQTPLPIMLRLRGQVIKRHMYRPIVAPYYIYALRHKSAQAIMDRLHAKGILCGTYYPVPLHLQGAFARLGYKEGDLPITEALCKETFAIPVYPELYIEERDAVISALLEAEYDR